MAPVLNSDVNPCKICLQSSMGGDELRVCENECLVDENFELDQCACHKCINPPNPPVDMALKDKICECNEMCEVGAGYSVANFCEECMTCIGIETSSSTSTSTTTTTTTTTTTPREPQSNFPQDCLVPCFVNPPVMDDPMNPCDVCVKTATDYPPWPENGECREECFVDESRDFMQCPCFNCLITIEEVALKIPPDSRVIICNCEKKGVCDVGPGFALINSTMACDTCLDEGYCGNITTSTSTSTTTTTSSSTTTTTISTTTTTTSSTTSSTTTTTTSMPMPMNGNFPEDCVEDCFLTEPTEDRPNNPCRVCINDHDICDDLCDNDFPGPVCAEQCHVDQNKNFNQCKLRPCPDSAEKVSRNHTFSASSG